MKQDLSLTIASLLSILFMSLHFADDVVRGYEPGTMSTMIGVLILVVWLYATVALAGRRSGYVIVLLASILGSGVPAIHMRGAGLGGKVALSSGAFLFIWTLIALGVTSIYSVIRSARGLWRLRSGPAR